MDRNEILSRAQMAKGPDEGQQYIHRKAQATGAGVFTLICFLLFTFDLWQGKNSYELFTAYWAFWGASSLAKYRMSRSRSDLLVGVCSIACTILFGALYILITMGILHQR